MRKILHKKYRTCNLKVFLSRLHIRYFSFYILFLFIFYFFSQATWDTKKATFPRPPGSILPGYIPWLSVLLRTVRLRLLHHVRCCVTVR